MFICLSPHRSDNYRKNIILVVFETNETKQTTCINKQHALIKNRTMTTIHISNFNVTFFETQLLSSNFTVLTMALFEHF